MWLSPYLCQVINLGQQVLCPFMHDQFYWAERMYWLGVAPEPLKRNNLFPETSDETSIRAAADVLSRAINDALSPEVKAHAAEISERLSFEVIILLEIFLH